MKKRWILPFLALLMLMAAVPVRAAAGDAEKAVLKERVKLFMEYGKAYDSKKLSAMMTEACKKKYDPFQAPITTVIKKINTENIKFKIRSVTVTENTAKVRVTATYFDGYVMYMDAMEDLLYWVSDHRTASDKTIQKKLAKYLSKEYRTCKKKNEFLEKVTFYMPFEKVDGTWYISEMTKNMLKVITSNYEQAYQDY